MATCWARSGGMLPAPLTGGPPHRHTEPPAQDGEVTSLQMVGVRSQCGLLRGQQPGLQTQRGHVQAVWPWADA